MSILGIGNFSQLKFTYTPFYYRARCDVKQGKRQKRRCLAKAALVKGRCRACEAQGSPVARGCDGQPGKARRNPSVRLRRPPPFDKGGTACQKTSPLLYRECRGDHWSPASLAQQRAFRDGFLARHTGTGEQCSPLQEFFDSLPKRVSCCLCTVLL